MSRRDSWRLLRRLVVRVLLGVALWLPVWVLEAASHNGPRPGLLLLVCVLVVVLVLTVVDAAAATAERWDDGRHGSESSRSRGRDRAMSTLLRVLEDHRSAREPTLALRDRLASLADRTLLARHGVALASPEGRALLGPAVTDVLDAAPHRIPLPRIEACLRRIEDL